MAEIIDLKEVLRARARRRERALTEQCLAILGECLEESRAAYPMSPADEREVRMVKLLQLEELIAYASARL